jgi:heterodisulfide reductase subunit C
MNEYRDILKVESGFAKRVASACNVDIYSCYQCQKCTNGCPVSFAMDYYPHQVIRMVQLGLEEEIKTVRSIWVCASCETCFTRCPNEIEIPVLMDYLKQWALKQEGEPVEGSILAFHRAFVNNIRRNGRVDETSLIRDYILKTVIEEKRIDIKEMFMNLKLGISMLKRGRLALLPERAGDIKAVKGLFDKED